MDISKNAFIPLQFMLRSFRLLKFVLPIQIMNPSLKMLRLFNELTSLQGFTRKHIFLESPDSQSHIYLKDYLGVQF